MALVPTEYAHDREHAFPWVVASTAVVCLLGGCANADRPAHPARTPVPISALPDRTKVGSLVPTSSGDCGTASDPGSPDGGVVAGLDWPTGERALRTPAQAYICIGGFIGSVVSVTQSGTPVTIRPARFTVPDGSRVLPLTITATTAGRTTLSLLVVDPAGRPQVRRPVGVVVADGDRWHFEQDR